MALRKVFKHMFGSRGRMLAGAGMAALMGVADAGAHDDAHLAQGDMGLALSEIFAREATTLRFIDYIDIPPGVDGTKTRFAAVFRAHPWAVVDYLRDVRAACAAPNVDDCPIEIRDRILGVFAGYEGSVALREWDEVRMRRFGDGVRQDSILQNLHDHWDSYDVETRRAGLQYGLEMMTFAFSDAQIGFVPAFIHLRGIQDATVAAYFQPVADASGALQLEVVMPPDALAAMPFDTAWDLMVHEGMHNIRQQMIWAADMPEYDGYFLEHRLRDDVMIFKYATSDMRVQYEAVDEGGWRRWHAVNPAERDVIRLAAQAVQFFDADMATAHIAHTVTPPF